MFPLYCVPPTTCVGTKSMPICSSTSRSIVGALSVCVMRMTSARRRGSRESGCRRTLCTTTQKTIMPKRVWRRLRVSLDMTRHKTQLAFKRSNSSYTGSGEKTQAAQISPTIGKRGVLTITITILAALSVRVDNNINQAPLKNSSNWSKYKTRSLDKSTVGHLIIR